MSTVTMILGESGTGKSTAMRNLDPSKVLLIQTIQKPLPFRTNKDGNKWEYCTKENKNGSIFPCDNSTKICTAIERMPDSKEIIIIDDFQYIMANEFMRGVTDEAKGNDAFMKYNRIAQNTWNILNALTNMPSNKRAYLLSHTQTDDFGKTKIKTIGKLLDEKITLEGMVSIVLRTNVLNGQYNFRTQNSGSDTVKSPLDMFDAELIDNDLSLVDAAICEYYGINNKEEQCLN